MANVSATARSPSGLALSHAVNPTDGDASTAISGGSFTADSLVVANPAVGEPAGTIAVSFRATTTLEGGDQIRLQLSPGFSAATGAYAIIQRIAAGLDCATLAADKCLVPAAGDWNNATKRFTFALTGTAEIAPADSRFSFIFDVNGTNQDASSSVRTRVHTYAIQAADFAR